MRLAEKYHIENAGGDAKEPQENPRVLDKESIAASAQELKPTPAITESSTEIQVEEHSDPFDITKLVYRDKYFPCYVMYESFADFKLSGKNHFIL